MNQGKLVFAQLMQHRPLTTFRRCVARYRGEFKVKSARSCVATHEAMPNPRCSWKKRERNGDGGILASSQNELRVQQLLQNSSQLYLPRKLNISNAERRGRGKQRSYFFVRRLNAASGNF